MNAHRKPETNSAEQGATTAELKEDIKRTRADLADTVEALAAKADIPTRVKTKARETSETVKLRTQHMTEQAMDKLPPPAREKTEHAVAAVQRNPKQLAMGVGVLLALWALARRIRHRRAAE